MNFNADHVVALARPIGIAPCVRIRCTDRSGSKAKFRAGRHESPLNEPAERREEENILAQQQARLKFVQVDGTIAVGIKVHDKNLQVAKRLTLCGIARREWLEEGARFQNGTGKLLSRRRCCPASKSERARAQC